MLGEIETILRDCPRARDSDNALFIELLKRNRKFSEHDIVMVEIALDSIDFNSMSRKRRLVQAENEELAPSKRVAKLRNEREERAVLTRGKSIADDRRYA